MAALVSNFFSREPKKKQTDKIELSNHDKNVIMFIDTSNGNVACLRTLNEKRLLSYLVEQPIPIENIKDSISLPNYCRLYLGNIKENLSPVFSKVALISSASLIAFLAYEKMLYDPNSNGVLTGTAVPIDADSYNMNIGGLVTPMLNGNLLEETIRLVRNNVLHQAQGLGIAMDLLALNVAREWIGNHLLQAGHLTSKNILFNMFTPSLPLYNQLQDHAFLKEYCIGWGQIEACTDMNTTLTLMDRVFQGDQIKAETFFQTLNQTRSDIQAKIKKINALQWRDANIPNLVSYGLIAGKTDDDAKKALLDWIRASFDKDALAFYHQEMKSVLVSTDQSLQTYKKLYAEAEQKDIDLTKDKWFGSLYPKTTLNTFIAEQASHKTSLDKTEKNYKKAATDISSVETIIQQNALQLKLLSAQFRRIENNILRDIDENSNQFDSDFYIQKSETIFQKTLDILTQYRAYIGIALPILKLSKSWFFQGFSTDGVKDIATQTVKCLSPIKTYNNIQSIYAFGTDALLKAWDLLLTFSPTRDQNLNAILFTSMTGSIIAHTFFGYNNVVYNTNIISNLIPGDSNTENLNKFLHVPEIAIALFHNMVAEHGYLGIPFITNYLTHVALLESASLLYNVLRKAAGCEFRPFRRDFSDFGNKVEWRIALDLCNIMDGPESELRTITLPKGSAYIVLKNAIQLTTQPYDPNPTLIHDMYAETSLPNPAFLNFFDLERRLPVFDFDNFIKRDFKTERLNIASRYKFIYLNNQSGKTLADIPLFFDIKTTINDNYTWAPTAIIMPTHDNILPYILAIDPNANLISHRQNAIINWFKLAYSIEKIENTPFTNEKYQNMVFSGVLLELIVEHTNLDVLQKSSNIDISEFNEELKKHNYIVRRDSHRGHDYKNRICEFEATIRMEYGHIMSEIELKHAVKKLRKDVYMLLLGKNNPSDQKSFLKSWLCSDNHQKYEDALLPENLHDQRLQAISTILEKSLNIVGLVQSQNARNLTVPYNTLINPEKKTSENPISLAAYQVPTVPGKYRWHYFCVDYLKQ